MRSLLEEHRLPLIIAQACQVAVVGPVKKLAAVFSSARAVKSRKRRSQLSMPRHACLCIFGTKIEAIASAVLWPISQPGGTSGGRHNSACRQCLLPQCIALRPNREIETIAFAVESAPAAHPQRIF